MKNTNNGKENTNNGKENTNNGKENTNNGKEHQRWGEVISFFLYLNEYYQTDITYFT